MALTIGIVGWMPLTARGEGATKSLADAARDEEDGPVATLHADELPVDLPLVRRLVNDAFPEYRSLALAPTRESGSSNVLFRLGDSLLVRLPRERGGGASIGKEAAWLPHVSRSVTTAVPTVLHVGEPALGYPEHWAITSWVPGARPPHPGSGSRHHDTAALAAGIAGFLSELRAMEAPAGAAHDPALSWYRGLPLADLDADFREAAADCRALRVDLDIDAALHVWDRAVDASSGVASALGWYHGDLLRENLLVTDSGELAAVLDFGGLGIGDPTVDLVVAWDALDSAGRRVLRDALDLDDAAWTASRGWALLLAMITFPYYGSSMPARCAERVAMAESAMTGV